MLCQRKHTFQATVRVGRKSRRRTSQMAQGLTPFRAVTFGGSRFSNTVMTSQRAESSETAQRAVKDAREADLLIGLTEAAEVALTRPGARLKALLVLAELRKRLDDRRMRALEAALAELLRQYLNAGLDEDRAALVRQLIADIGAKGREDL